MTEFPVFAFLFCNFCIRESSNESLLIVFYCEKTLDRSLLLLQLLSKQIGISGHIHRLVAGSMAGKLSLPLIRRSSRCQLDSAQWLRNGSQPVFPWPLIKCCTLAGMTAVICTYPLDVVRARLAFQVTGDHRYTGIINAFQTIYLKVMHVFCGHLMCL